MNQPVPENVISAAEAASGNQVPLVEIKERHWLRVLLAFIAGSLVSLAALAMMQNLISQRKAIASQDYDFNVVDFVRLKKDTVVEARERRLPDKPKPPEELKQELLDISMEQDISQQDMEFDIPALDLPNNLTGGPRLGGLMSHGTGGSDSSVIPLVRIQPQYPRRAAMNGTEGEVLLAFTITPTGTVRDVSVVKANPRGVFDRAAKRAILKWKFKPKVVDGKAVSQQAQQKLVFKLSN